MSRLINEIKIPTEDFIFNNDETTDWLKNINKVNNLLKPIIILGERDYYEHYITILGFNNTKNEFYVYDSFFDKGEKDLTIDENNDLPGNRTFTSNELLTFWSNGGMYGLYNWYTIVASYLET